MLPKKKTSSVFEFVSGLTAGASAMPAKWSRRVFSFRFYEGKISVPVTLTSCAFRKSYSGLLCWRDSHPLEWQLASLNGVAGFAAFATTFRSSNLICPATQSGLYQPTCRLDLNGKLECSMVQVDPYAVQNYRELARDGDCRLSLLVRRLSPFATCGVESPS